MVRPRCHSTDEASPRRTPGRHRRLATASLPMLLRRNETPLGGEGSVLGDDDNDNDDWLEQQFAAPKSDDNDTETAHPLVTEQSTARWDLLPKNKEKEETATSIQKSPPRGRGSVLDHVVVSSLRRAVRAGGASNRSSAGNTAKDNQQADRNTETTYFPDDSAGTAKLENRLICEALFDPDGTNSGTNDHDESFSEGSEQAIFDTPTLMNSFRLDYLQTRQKSQAWWLPNAILSLIGHAYLNWIRFVQSFPKWSWPLLGMLTLVQPVVALVVLPVVAALYSYGQKLHLSSILKAPAKMANGFQWLWQFLRRRWIDFAAGLHRGRVVLSVALVLQYFTRPPPPAGNHPRHRR